MPPKDSLQNRTLICPDRLILRLACVFIPFQDRTFATESLKTQGGRFVYDRGILHRLIPEDLRWVRVFVKDIQVDITH
jgi:hypothetical protein